MNKIVARCIFISSASAYVVISLCAPWVLSDKNTFLAGFVNHELLNLLGVVVAITLASSANLHLEFNNIEDAAGRVILSRTRAAVKKSAMWLIILFVLAFIITIVKPLIPASDIGYSFINGFAILIVLFNLLVLVDLTKLVFRIQPKFTMFAEQDTPDEK